MNPTTGAAMPVSAAAIDEWGGGGVREAKPSIAWTKDMP